MIELVMTLLIMGVITLAIYPFLQSAIGHSELKRAVWEMSDNLRRAQVQTMSGVQDSVWGVRFETTGYILFKGDAFNPAEPENVSFVLPPQISITDVNLNGSGFDLLFQRPTGRTNEFGTITLQDASTLTAGQITVTLAGKINHD